MADEATRAYYAQERDLKKGKAQADFEQYMANLARAQSAAAEGLNANYESRGILRSGEANVGRIRQGEQYGAMGQAAQTNLDYNKNLADIEYLRQLAALQAATPAAGGTGGGGGTTTPLAPAAPPTSPAAPTAPAAPARAISAGQATTPGAATSVRPGATYAAPAAPVRAVSAGQATTPGAATSVSSNATFAPKPAITLPPGIDFGALAAATKPKPKPATGGGTTARFR